MAKQKKGKLWLQKPVRHGKDGRKIGVHHKASSGEGRKEQQWSEADLDRAFDLWEANDGKQPGEKLSKCQIALEHGIPYTTFCERVSGRRGGGKRGKIARGKWEPKILNWGKQAGNIKWVTITITITELNKWVAIPTYPTWPIFPFSLLKQIKKED